MMSSFPSLLRQGSQKLPRCNTLHPTGLVHFTVHNPAVFSASIRYHSYTDPQSCTHYWVRDQCVCTTCCTISSNLTYSQRKPFPLSLFFLRAKVMNINVIMLTVNWQWPNWPKKAICNQTIHLALIILSGSHLASVICCRPLDCWSVLSVHCCTVASRWIGYTYFFTVTTCFLKKQVIY